MPDRIAFRTTLRPGPAAKNGRWRGQCRADPVPVPKPARIMDRQPDSRPVRVPRARMCHRP